MQGLRSFRRLAAPTCRLRFAAFALVCALLPVLGNAQQIWVRTNGPNQGQAGHVHSLGKYLLTTGSNGVTRSTDYGNSWSIGSGSTRYSTFAEVGQTLFASTDTSVDRSDDNGLTWTSCGPNSSVSVAAVAKHVFSTHTPDINYSSDLGKTWNLVRVGSYAFQKLCASEQNVYGTTDLGAIFRSSDTGKNWEMRVPPHSGNPIYNVDAEDDRVFATFSPWIWRSLDRGETWTPINSGFAPLYQGSPIYILGTSVYVGTVDGVYCSSNNGASWYAMNSGLPVGHDTVTSLYSQDGYLFATIKSNNYVWRYEVPPPPPPAPIPTPAYIAPDAAAAGMCVAVEMIAPFGAPSGYFGTDGRLFGPDTLVRLANPSDQQYVRLGPATISNDGKVIQAMVMVEPSATARMIPLNVYLNGDAAQTAATVQFQIVNPSAVSLNGTSINVARSQYNTVVVDSLVLSNGTYTFPANDPSASVAGNQALLPLRILSAGPIRLQNATIDVSGFSAVTGTGGGAGGPGGGGGGAGYAGPSAGIGGNGFTGGGGEGESGGTSPVGGEGSGSRTGPNRYDGGSSLNGVPGGQGLLHALTGAGDDGTGGGTGYPFGSSGVAGVSNASSPAGGYGGASAGGSSGKNPDFGGGGGGYATDGTQGGGNGDNRGHAYGNAMLVPFAGGSGGGGGNATYGGTGGSGSGGGGGGAIDLTSFSSVSLNGALLANGGNGSNGQPSFVIFTGQTPCAGGGAGSGGAVMISARDSFTASAAATIQRNGGTGGAAGNAGGTASGNGGDGGMGRIRVNARASLQTPMSFFDAAKDFVGPTIQKVVFGPDTIPFAPAWGNDSSFMVNLFGGMWTPNGVGSLNLRVYYAWSTSYKWDTLPVSTVSAGPNSHTLMCAAGPGPISTNNLDTELYVVAVQVVDNPHGGIPTATPSAVMSHTSGIIVKAPPRIGKLALDNSLDFGKVRKGTCKDSTFKVSNVGNGDLTITSQTFGNSQFKLIAPPSPVVIHPGEDTTVTLEFCPTGYGTVLSTDTVHTTVGDSIVRLKGYTGKGQLAAIPQVEFGKVNVGDCKYDTITITNMGDDSLVLTGNTNFNPPFFYKGTVGRQDPFSLAAGESTQIVLEYCPTDTVESYETVLLDTIGPGEPTTFKLHGTGIRSNVVLDANAIDFGCVVYGTNAQGYLSILNRGNADDRIRSIAISPSDLPIALGVRDTAIAAHSHDTVSLTLTPQLGASSSGTITVTTQAGAVLTMSVRARFSPPPSITALDPVLKFDSVDVGDSASMCLRITNYSCVAVDSIWAVVSHPMPPFQFQLTPESVLKGAKFGSLADSAVDTFCVQFKPTQGGPDTASFEIVSGKGAPAISSIQLTGIGRTTTIPVQLAIDSVYGRPGQTVNVFVRTLNDVTKAAITSVTFRVMFDPMQLDIKGATMPNQAVEVSQIQNNIEPNGGSPHTTSISEHRYSLGDREYTVTFPTPLTGKAVVAALPFEILMPNASVAAVRLADASFGVATAKLSTKTDGAVVIEQCDTSDRLFYNGAPMMVIQNNPNPFNPRTIVPLKIAQAGHVTMTVYNSVGAKVITPIDANVPSGDQHVVIDASALPSGAYRYITVWSNGSYTMRDEKTMIVRK